MYKYIGGISPDEAAPGFKHTIFRPAINSSLESAMSEHESMYGEVKCFFAKRDGKTSINIKVPFGCTATLYLPESYVETLCESGKKVAESYSFGVKKGACGAEMYISLVSGEYNFETA